MQEINRDDIGNKNSDWFDELSDAQKEDVLTGLSEADNEETILHQDVVKLFGKWGLK